MAAGLVAALFIAAPALAQEIPRDAPNCGLRAPPEAAAKGVRPPHRLPMRMFPVNPGGQYTGCQWIWIAYARPDVWDYSAVTYYENGAPRLQRIAYPPLPVQGSLQTCVYGADGGALKRVEGNDWQIECRSARQLQELLRITPKDGDGWDFL